MRIKKIDNRKHHNFMSGVFLFMACMLLVTVGFSLWVLGIGFYDDDNLQWIFTMAVITFIAGSLHAGIADIIKEIRGSKTETT